MPILLSSGAACLPSGSSGMNALHSAPWFPNRKLPNRKLPNRKLPNRKSPNRKPPACTGHTGGTGPNALRPQGSCALFGNQVARLSVLPEERPAVYQNGLSVSDWPAWAHVALGLRPRSQDVAAWHLAVLDSGLDVLLVGSLSHEVTGIEGER